MATAYVYAPIGGIITGRENYCGFPCDNNPCTGDHGTHSTCKSGWLSPVDIAGTGSIYLYVNYPTVKSVKTFIEFECCCNVQNDYGRIIKVLLYGKQNSECYIGMVVFGHINSPAVSNNQLYNLTSNQLRLGQTVGGSHNCNGITCYSGTHVHMERWGGQTIAPCCCASAVKGGTPIYQWNFAACTTSVTPSES